MERRGRKKNCSCWCCCCCRRRRSRVDEGKEDSVLPARKNRPGGGWLGGEWLHDCERKLPRGASELLLGDAADEELLVALSPNKPPPPPPPPPRLVAENEDENPLSNFFLAMLISSLLTVLSSSSGRARPSGTRIDRGSSTGLGYAGISPVFFPTADEIFMFFGRCTTGFDPRA